MPEVQDHVKPVTTVRIDTTALKKAMPEVAQAFTRQTTAGGFTRLPRKSPLVQALESISTKALITPAGL